ncbi:MAG: response regulator transcription factor [Anaerolineae bacterium]|nr:response regulator transcription factor [Anaerolineae bacterium]
MPATVVLIGESTSVFAAPLKKQYTTYRFRSGKQGLIAAQTYHTDVIVLDAVSLKTSGERICKTLREALPKHTIIHIHPASKEVAESQADMLLFPPLTARTLINTIEHLISHKEALILRCGIFALDIERRILMVDGDETVLTKTQASIVAIFLKHPNQNLERKWLVQQIWDTNFTEDTRTLSVHIRHVRKVMEVDASKPQYLKTVRGIGYRLEVSEK